MMMTELSQVNTCTKFQWRRVIAGSHGPGAVFEAFLLRFGRLFGSIAAEVPIRLKQDSRISAPDTVVRDQGRVMVRPTLY